MTATARVAGQRFTFDPGPDAGVRAGLAGELDVMAPRGLVRSPAVIATLRPLEEIARQLRAGPGPVRADLSGMDQLTRWRVAELLAAMAGRAAQAGPDRDVSVAQAAAELARLWRKAIGPQPAGWSNSR